MHLSVSSRPPEADANHFYPDSDGRPVGETPIHNRDISDLDLMSQTTEGQP